MIVHRLSPRSGYSHNTRAYPMPGFWACWTPSWATQRTSGRPVRRMDWIRITLICSSRIVAATRRDLRQIGGTARGVISALVYRA